MWLEVIVKTDQKTHFSFRETGLFLLTSRQLPVLGQEFEKTLNLLNLDSLTQGLLCRQQDQ